jgi:hypothetical protein
MTAAKVTYGKEYSMRWQCAVPLVLTAFIVACATSPDARLSQAERHSERAILALAKKTDADSLAAAGLLSLQGHRNDSLALFDRAVAASPARPELVWLQAQNCRAAPPCDPEPMERRLRELDPANGAGWLGALARADSQNDAGAMDVALAALGRSQRVDVYWTTLVAGLSGAVAQTRTMSLNEAEVVIIGLLAAEAIPAYRVASNACKGERLQRVEVIETCRGVAKAFEQGDTYITEMIGIAIAKRVWPEQSVEWRAATDARQVFEYRSKLAAKLESDWQNERQAESYLALCGQNRREQDVSRALLIRAGLRPDPPGD